MMQTILVILIVSSAGVYLGWKFYAKFVAKQSKCDDCAVSQVTDPRN